MADTDRLDARALAGAVRSVVGRTIGGVALGVLFGVAVFALERGLGWLGGDGWRGVVSWLMLPLFAFAGAAVLGFSFAIGGLRRAARRLVVDSGLLRRMVERAQDKLPDELQDRPRGWLGGKLYGICSWLVTQLRTSKQPAEAVDRFAREQIDGWYATPVYLAWAALAVLVVVPPLLL